ncbi:hypothetical protein BO70DRAFT_359956 [Aspergillus heteromorphus CBS 117.55]|uniref:Uncharacterized protein n=1 Tax=Aspergillus heteromorphus CBS 117.55 TaxID=1448321 RepID=A0A317WW19_9EURO|nr:uncharacterized protein BO70DRAFT_359956 [Aspergillus heteromorphus CBS 117.55]PWY88500.1 hypothetical protein BO70DRAFT_359956 [Aspergillus heteromorphus CBS 117.55]
MDTGSRFHSIAHNCKSSRHLVIQSMQHLRARPPPGEIRNPDEPTGTTARGRARLRGLWHRIPLVTERPMKSTHVDGAGRIEPETAHG